MAPQDINQLPDSGSSSTDQASPDSFIIRRHPIGIILVYLEMIGVFFALGLFTILVYPSVFRDLSVGDYAWMGIMVAIIGVGTLFILLVATYIYNQNRILITDHDVEQITQRGLLVRKSARLELSDVEDVSVTQKGLLPTLFGYGTLTIETAGAEDNFVFSYCSNPNYYAHKVLQARGRYIALGHTRNP